MQSLQCVLSEEFLSSAEASSDLLLLHLMNMNPSSSSTMMTTMSGVDEGSNGEIANGYKTNEEEDDEDILLAELPRKKTTTTTPPATKKAAAAAATATASAAVDTGPETASTPITNHFDSVLECLDFLRMVENDENVEKHDVIEAIRGRLHNMVSKVLLGNTITSMSMLGWRLE